MSVIQILKNPHGECIFELWNNEKKQIEKCGNLAIAKRENQFLCQEHFEYLKGIIGCIVVQEEKE